MSHPQALCLHVAPRFPRYPLGPSGLASAYDGRPKLVIILVIDQFRADYLDRYRADFKGRGFRLFLDHGAYFADCYYDYANTKTAPGHATLGTGAYTDGHGISANAWWDLSRNKARPVSSVEDERYRLVGASTPAKEPGASPLNLRASTVGDELRLATQGQAKVFGISLKDRAAILPAGYSANGAYWIDPASGASSLPATTCRPPRLGHRLQCSGRIAQAEQEAGTPIPDTSTTLSAQPLPPTPTNSTSPAPSSQRATRQTAVTDMLTISLSANDILGHEVGPDSPRAADGRYPRHAARRLLHLARKERPRRLGECLDRALRRSRRRPGAAAAYALGLPAAAFDMSKFTASLNDSMNGNSPR